MHSLLRVLSCFQTFAMLFYLPGMMFFNVQEGKSNLASKTQLRNPLFSEVPPAPGRPNKVGISYLYYHSAPFYASSRALITVFYNLWGSLEAPYSSCICSTLVFLCVCVCVVYDGGDRQGGERRRGEEWRGEERGGENLKQDPSSAQSPMQGSIPQPWDYDLSRNQELDTQLTEPLRCPHPSTFKPGRPSETFVQ